MASHGLESEVFKAAGDDFVGGGFGACLAVRILGDGLPGGLPAPDEAANAL